MKKAIAILSLAALALTSTAFAQDNNKDHQNKDNRGWHLGIFNKLEHFEDRTDKADKKVDATRFVLTGSVVATTSASITVNVKSQVHATVVNNQATVAVTADTKIARDKDQAAALASLKAGDQIVITGTLSGTTMTASKIHLIAVRGKAYGEVTAKTDTSITVKNAVTGVSQIFTTSGDTKVIVNGEAKTTADVQVGDKGFVKFKSDVSGLFAKFVALFR